MSKRNFTVVLVKYPTYTRLINYKTRPSISFDEIINYLISREQGEQCRL